MRFGPFLILLCLYISQCNGVPPRKVATKSRGAPITDHEDRFIVEQLSSLYVDNESIFALPLWKTIADNHRRKCQQNMTGFFQERSAETLRGRLRLMAKYNRPDLNSKLPEHLLRAARQDLNRSSRGSRAPYTEQEEKFFIDELSKPCPDSPFSISTLERIHQKHTAKFQAGTAGFENERTLDSVRTYVQRMKTNGRLPDDVLRRIKIYERGASSSQPTPSSQQTDLEETDEEEYEEDEDE